MTFVAVYADDFESLVSCARCEGVLYSSLASKYLSVGIVYFKSLSSNDCVCHNVCTFLWIIFPIQLQQPDIYIVIISLLFLQDHCQYRFLNEWWLFRVYLASHIAFQYMWLSEWFLITHIKHSTGSRAALFSLDLNGPIHKAHVCFTDVLQKKHVCVLGMCGMCYSNIELIVFSYVYENQK